jgi:hypothetical protein
MQTALDAALLYPNPRPKPTKSPLLVDILVGDLPKMQAVYNINGRTLSVTVWDNQIDLHLAGPNGGQGDQITLTPAILADIVAATVQ